MYLIAKKICRTTVQWLQISSDEVDWKCNNTTFKKAVSVFGNERPPGTHLGEESADRQTDPFPCVGDVPRVPGDGPWAGSGGSHRARHRHRCGGHKLFRGKKYAELVQQKNGKLNPHDPSTR